MLRELMVAATAASLAMTWSCGYNANYGDNCTIACSTNVCPDGFSCVDGYCHQSGAAETCNAIRDAPPALDSTSANDGQPSMDALPIDAPGHDADIHTDASSAGPHTLSATAAGTTDDQSSIGCGDGMTFTDQNSYYRVFPLDAFGITGTPFHVTNVDFVVETAIGSLTLTVKVGTYSGTPGNTLTTADIVSTTNAMKATAAGDTSEDVPVVADIAVDGIVLVEVDAPSGGSGEQFEMGANTGTETEPSYISSTNSECGVTTPTKTSIVTSPGPDWLLTVTGTTD